MSRLKAGCHLWENDMSKVEPVIKQTVGGKFHAAGGVVDTLEDAFDRCDAKCKGWNNYFFVFPAVDGVRNEICGDRDYIMEVLG